MPDTVGFVWPGSHPSEGRQFQRSARRQRLRHKAPACAGARHDRGKAAGARRQPLKSRIPTQLVERSDAPCQEVVVTGDKVDILQWPFPLWNIGDTGRYITAGNIIAHHPEFGWNIAYHRAQLTTRTNSESAWRRNITCATRQMKRAGAAVLRPRSLSEIVRRSASRQAPTFQWAITSSMSPARSKASQSGLFAAKPLLSRFRKILRWSLRDISAVK